MGAHMPAKQQLTPKARLGQFSCDAALVTMNRTLQNVAGVEYGMLNTAHTLHKHFKMLLNAAQVLHIVCSHCSVFANTTRMLLDTNPQLALAK